MTFELTTVFQTPGGADIRTHDAPDGTRWIVAADICKVLGIKNNRQAVSRLDASAKGVCLIDTLGGRQKVTTVNDAGFWRLEMRSDKPFAARFGTWLATHVIPAVVRHGAYVAGAEGLSKEAQSKLYAEMRDKVGNALRLHDHKTQHDHWGKPSRQATASLWAAQVVARETGLPLSVVNAAARGGVKGTMTAVTNQQGKV